MALPVQQFQDCRCYQAGDCTRQDVLRQGSHPIGPRRWLSLSALFIWLLRREKPAYLVIFSAFSIAIPAIIGLSIAINWQAVFFLMHRVLFRNTYWFFDPETDPVILILPSEFFMHCGVMIVCLILLFAAVSFGIYWVMRRRLRKKRQIIKVSAEQKPEEKQPVSVS